ncbi:right-handed parallel beta-helix repeat-containing protein [Micromonospora sp. WMMD882]|uniref:right-handed parallel beta-helix repeat-containing protein n=1 Tax=Micromonospora sp. WMMD882 TaxID=3015151 RepID=UPI00248B5728|nr:right-handed parallel beta-helix repeat-containing protein [Micromonospora sp. WMMD882]WBB77277.1 right-handed parallel beta-helix repeat-containing protein [Micromonospora sp. WMMD882]
MTRTTRGRLVRPAAALGLGAVAAYAVLAVAPTTATTAHAATSDHLTARAAGAGGPATRAALNPVADAWADSMNPTRNQGAGSYLKVDGVPVVVAYLRFDVRGADADSTGVLRFHVETGSSTGVEVRDVGDEPWGETTLTYHNAPPVGPVVGSSGPVEAGTWVSVDVSELVTGNGPVTFALTTGNDTGVRITSREGTEKPELIVPAPPSPSPYLVTKIGSSTYQAVSETTGHTYTGRLKTVVESAVTELDGRGGGTIRFGAGTFDLGTDYFKIVEVADVEFVGAGMDLTVIRNSSSASADTEPFNTKGAVRMTIRDLTVSAGGPTRSTSDALDFDDGVDVLVERVRVNAARGRGIVFDGKNQGWSSTGNTVRDCVVTGVASDGIELLAASRTTVTGCRISHVGGHGIQVNRSSSGADQPNKTSDRNVLTGNRIDQAGQDGVSVDGGEANQIMNNHITNSSDDTSGRDGIRITTPSGIPCQDNIVAGNIATDDQSARTQRYGLHIVASGCRATVVGPGNDFAGNLSGAIRDVGTGTLYQ